MPRRIGKTLTPLSITLILISALLHSSWNFFAKRGNWPMEFYFWVFLCSSLLYLPFFFGFGVFPSFFSKTPLWAWSLNFISGLIQTIYFICLIVAYRKGDLSLVYPISRSAPLFTLLWATLFIGEILSSMGVFGISLVILGIFVISMRGFHLKSLSPQPKESFSSLPYLLAFIAALSGSVYSVVDKVVVQILHPVFYTWLINIWMCIDVGIYLFFHREAPILKVWQESKKEIFIIILLQNIGYGCFLMALTMSKVSYVVAFRQVGVLFGAGMGILFLKESQWKARITGALILTLGLVLIGLAK
jgi:drug/metabolite transporter (DMT)-like permease